MQHLGGENRLVFELTRSQAMPGISREADWLYMPIAQVPEYLAEEMWRLAHAGFAWVVDATCCDVYLGTQVGATHQVCRVVLQRAAAVAPD